MNKIVLTGGPCAGKTTCLRAVKEEFGNQVVILPEAATMLLEGGFPIPGNHLSWSPKWQQSFQSAILSIQKELESAYELVACEHNARLLVCDRGILDGSAYWSGGLIAFSEHFSLQVAECYSRYVAILHLESLATANPEKYGKAGNDKRFEGVEEAAERELLTRNAWEGHSSWVLISGRRDVGAKISEVLGIVRFLLTTAR